MRAIGLLAALILAAGPAWPQSISRNGAASVGANDGAFPQLQQSPYAGRIATDAAPRTLAGRSPQQSDDSSVYVAGQSGFGFNGNIYNPIDVTAGFSMWQPSQPGPLPLDAVGLYIYSALPQAAGTGFATADTVLMPSGAVLTVRSQVAGVITTPSFAGYISNGTSGVAGNLLTVTSVAAGVVDVGEMLLTGGAANWTQIISRGTGTGGTGTYNLLVGAGQAVGTSGSPASFTATPFAMTAPNLAIPANCTAPSNPVTPISTSGSGTGLTVNYALLTPTAYGTRKLSRCYSGNAMTVARSDTGETTTVPFLSDGSLDAATLFGFAAGTTPMNAYVNWNSGPSPRVSIWNNQSLAGSANDATQVTATNRMTVSPSRKLGNAYSVMGDSHGGNGSTTADVNNPVGSFLNIPAAVTLYTQNFSISALAGVQATQYTNVGLLEIGGSSGVRLDQGTYPECSNGVGSNPQYGVVLTDTANLYTCVGQPHGVTMDSNVTSVFSGTWSNTFTAYTGGLIGQNVANNATGDMDIAAAVIIPWQMTAAQRVAFEASMNQTFGVTPQAQGVMVMIGDSHDDGWHATYQQSWPRAMMAQLNRPDIQMVNSAASGAQMCTMVSTGNWNNYVLPALNSANFKYKYVLLGSGGYNDLGAAKTVAQTEACFLQGVQQTHAAGAKAVCVLDYFRNGTLVLNQNMQSVMQWLASPAAQCDAYINFEAYSTPPNGTPFNALAGPWSGPWFGSDGIHATAAGNWLLGTIAAAAMAPLLP